MLLQATRDYNVGAPPEPVVAEVASQMGVHLPQNFAPRKCDHAQDVVRHDLILVMDKYTASDFLKEVRMAFLCVLDGCNTVHGTSIDIFHLHKAYGAVWDDFACICSD